MLQGPLSLIASINTEDPCWLLNEKCTYMYIHIYKYKIGFQ